MFVIDALRSRMRRVRREESGFAMIAVIGVMALALVVASTLVGSTAFALAQTTAARAEVQSQASADAGIQVGYAALAKNACASVPTSSSTDPKFSLAVYNRTSLTGAWASGCPTNSSVQVRLVSIGTASSNPTGTTRGTTTTAEAVYAWTPSTVASNPSGSAVYVYSGSSFNSFTVSLGPGVTNGDVMIRTGSFACSSNTVINGSVVVYSGSINISNNCRITGSLKASGPIAVSANVQIGGDVVSSGGSVSLSNSGITVGGSVYANGTFTSQSTVGGNVEATGNVSMTGASGLVKGYLRTGGSIDLIAETINGDVTAVGNASIAASGVIGGSLITGGTLTNFQGTVNGSATVVGDVSLTAPGALIKGDLRAGGSLPTLAGVVNGAVTAAGTAGTSFTPDAVRVGKDLTVGGTLSSWNYDYSMTAAQGIKAKGWVVGTITERKTGLPPVAAPSGPTPQSLTSVPDWIDVGYASTDWAKAGFSNFITWPSNVDCQIGTWNNSGSSTTASFWTQLNNLTVPTVVDTRTCSTLTFQDQTMTFKTDVSFIGKAFTFGNDTFQAAGTANRNVYFIVPDAAPTAAGPNCSAGDISTWGSNTVKAPLAIMAYTPCTISLNNGSLFRGQLYGQNVTDSSGDGLVYVPVGIPGYDLGGGAASSSGGTAAGLGALSSYGSRAGG